MSSVYASQGLAPLTTAAPDDSVAYPRPIATTGRPEPTTDMQPVAMPLFVMIWWMGITGRGPWKHSIVNDADWLGSGAGYVRWPRGSARPGSERPAPVWRCRLFAGRIRLTIETDGPTAGPSPIMNCGFGKYLQEEAGGLLAQDDRVDS
jgi:hypothetical protein